MNKKPITPYNRLLSDVRAFFLKAAYPHTVTMWWYSKEKLDNGWDLTKLYERVQAAEQLGYEVVLVAEERGLVVNYRKKMPTIPWEWRRTP